MLTQKREEKEISQKEVEEKLHSTQQQLEKVETAFNESQVYMHACTHKMLLTCFLTVQATNDTLKANITSLELQLASLREEMETSKTEGDEMIHSLKTK